MFQWLERIVLRRIIKRIKAQLPLLQQLALEKKDDLIEEIKKAIKEKVFELAEKL